MSSGKLHILETVLALGLPGETLLEMPSLEIIHLMIPNDLDYGGFIMHMMQHFL